MIVAIILMVVRNIYNWMGCGDCNTSPYNVTGTEDHKKHLKKPFLQQHVLVRPHHDIPGSNVWQPILSLDQVQRRGFSTVGTTLVTAIKDIFTWAIEYKAQSLLRVFMYDFCIGRYSKKHSPENTYDAIINCSTACFIKRESGHLEMYNTILPYKKDGLRRYHKIILELDHKNMKCDLARVQEYKHETTEQVFDDPQEVGMIAFFLLSSKTHVHTHWFANGVEETASYWSLAKESSKMVQSMNLAAVHSSPFVLGIPMKNLATMLFHNVVAEGLPHHHTLPPIVKKRSRPHIMAAKARRSLRSMCIPAPYAETIIAATIMHSADHYYCDFFFGYDGQTKFMKNDFTVFRLALTAPNKYRTKEILCRQHLDDPVSRAIYNAAHEVDSTFAEEALFITVAN